MAGCSVLVTADRRAAELGTALARRGAVVHHAPALSITNAVDDAALLAATADLVEHGVDVLVVTTGIGFRSWVEAADSHGLGDALHATLAQARIVARGPKARGAIQAAGLTPDWVAESETAAEVGELLLGEGVEGLRVAVQHHGAGSDGLDGLLTAAGAQVVPLVVYRWGPPPDPEALRRSVVAAAAGEFDAVVFTSAPGAEAWLSAADEVGVLPALRERFDDGTVAAAVGPVTARPLVRLGVTPLQPERGRLGALVRALVEHFTHAEHLAVDTVRGRLCVRSRVALLDGEVLPLSPSGVEVLRLLASAAGGVVTRAQVLAVLPGDSQDPHAAEVAVARVRESVGRELVRTVVKRGYRLAVA
ncbi:uroporphyrinogen-III synthase [Actinotalea caeni]|uniref:uroporphyrinogen-III synthase n=1 Tax=Actinotalea caeni TaxID=1348467 RepID=UPI0012E2E3CF|nr:uroporphyrinogen-III synthase [Actinotalea caeni]